MYVPNGKGDMASFEWPPDVEAAIFERIRPHVQCALKKRTWAALHEELLRKAPPLKRLCAKFLMEMKGANHEFVTQPLLYLASSHLQ